ncbi:unnamed protein product [Microthlaspi erraticum]|uniref:Exoribonuclease phosphorolytic domain-containing protein n=1 Tax=Microthlaspi erraticum TaxID=1685480 RepID=A0A6D2HS52_9BRAS|nr:unnamed protein product [Microthlaspi erraticum]
MALAVVRSCVMSARVTIGQLRVLQSKASCHAQGAEFVMRIASKIRSFSCLPSFYSLNPPVIEEIKYGSHIINLEFGSDEQNRTCILCHMDGTAVQSCVMVSHDYDNYNDNKVLEVFYNETPYGESLETLEAANGKRREFYNPTDQEVHYNDWTRRYGQRWDPRDPTDGEEVYSDEMTDYEESWEDLDLGNDPMSDSDFQEINQPDSGEMICCHLIDRSIRPLFPETLYANITVSSRLLTSNSKHNADLMGTIASSAALMISNITPSGPLGVIRIGRINEKLIVNPTEDEVLCSARIGEPGEAQSADSLDVLPRKRFSVVETSSASRRKEGRGMFVEKALLAVIPPERDFPYTIIVNPTVLYAHGSSSTTSICAGSIALMDAGVPLQCHVAGVCLGLVSDDDKLDGNLENYRIITDISDVEHHLTEMDLKIAGTRNGITAIQLDVKPGGIPLDIICEALSNGREARLQVLDHMERVINSPKETCRYNKIEDA